jgi:hypothetical protein
MPFASRSRACALAAAVVFAVAPSRAARAGDPGVDRKAIDERVREDLDAAYAAFAREERSWLPPFDLEVSNLASTSPSVRERAGAYLASLIRTTDADARAGRTPRRQGWSLGGPQDVGDEVRWSVARALRAASFRGGGGEAFEAVLWLARQDRLDELRQLGSLALVRIRHPDADAAIVALVREPAPSFAVLEAALGAVAERRLVAAKDGVLALCAHYRSEVSAAARKAAEALGLQDVPAFDPSAALPASVRIRLANLAACVPDSLPADARWGRFRFAWPRAFDFDDFGGRTEIRGWVLATNERGRVVLDEFGHLSTFAEADVTESAESLEESARALVALRDGRKASDTEDAFTERVGMRDFFVAHGDWRGSLPEALIAAWCEARGKHEAARDLVLPLLRAHAEEGGLFALAFEQLASRLDRDMLDAFTGRDPARALALARHLSTTRFDSFWAQSRAKELLTEIPTRGDDFQARRLPRPAEWDSLRVSMTRAQRIGFLADRLRLIHDVQTDIPGGVSWGSAQYDVPDAALPTVQSAREAHRVINPYVELGSMDLTGAEVAELAPRLANDEHLLAYDLPMFMPHYPRELHRVRWLLVTLAQSALGEDAVDREAVQSRDASVRARAIEALVGVARRSPTARESDRRAAELDGPGDDGVLQAAYGRLARLDADRCARVILGRAAREPARAAEWVRLAYAADAPNVTAEFDAFATSPDLAGFWAAAAHLRHGQGERRRLGLQRVLSALDRDEAISRVDVVLDDLLATADPAAEAFLDRLLASPAPRGPTVFVLQRGLARRRTAAFDLVAQALEGKGLPTGPDDDEGHEFGAGTTWRTADAAIRAVLGWYGLSTPWVAHETAADQAARKAAALLILKTAREAAVAGHPLALEMEPRPIPLGAWSRVSSGWVLRTR